MPSSCYGCGEKITWQMTPFSTICIFLECPYGAFVNCTVWTFLPLNDVVNCFLPSVSWSVCLGTVPSKIYSIHKKFIDLICYIEANLFSSCHQKILKLGKKKNLEVRGKEFNTQVVTMAHTSGDSFQRDCVEVHRENIVNSIFAAAGVAAAVMNNDLLTSLLLPGTGLGLEIYCKDWLLTRRSEFGFVVMAQKWNSFFFLLFHPKMDDTMDDTFTVTFFTLFHSALSVFFSSDGLSSCCCM